jgi:hypothetical protein
LDEKTLLAVVAAVGTIVSALAALGGIYVGWWLKVRSDEALWNLEQRLSSYVTLLNHIDAYSLLATQLYRADEADLLTRKTNTQESYSTVDSAITVVELLCPNGLRGTLDNLHSVCGDLLLKSGERPRLGEPDWRKFYDPLGPLEQTLISQARADLSSRRPARPFG